MRTRKREADASSSNPAALRARTRLAESGDGSARRVPVLLIQEGLGNLKDCFFYTKDCLKNSVDVFEGAKAYANHPDAIEEQTRPERSVRDIIGHYENVSYIEKNNRGALKADLVILDGDDYDWAESLLTNAIEYSKKYHDEEFVGLSINANGEADTAPIDDFLADTSLCDDVQEKLELAKSEGIDEIKPVNVLKDAVSVDLVTEAGAGGKILTMMERNKKPMKVKGKVTEGGKKVTNREDGGGKHDDAEQDKALFQKMIKQHVAKGADEEEAMKMAQAFHKHAKSEGMEGEAAAEAAEKHMAAAAAAGLLPKKKEKKEGEHEGEAEGKHENEGEAEGEGKHEAEDDGDDQAPPAKPGKKEAAVITKLQAEVAALKEKDARREIDAHVAKITTGTEYGSEFIESFKKTLGKARSVKHVDEIWNVFTEAHKVANGDDDGEVNTENSSDRLRESTGGKVISFKDCVK